MTLVHQSMRELAEYTWQSSSMFDALTRCMSLQPDIDPQAGHGPFQILVLLKSSNIEVGDAAMISRRVKNNAIVFYLLVRGIWAGAITADDLISFGRGLKEIDLLKIMRDTLNFIPSLNASVFEENVQRVL